MPTSPLRPRLSRFYPLAACAAMAGLLLGGCTFFRMVRASKLKTPTFEYVRCDLRSFDERSAHLEIAIKAFNPNTIGLRNVFVDYSLFHRDQRFLTGAELALELSPNGESRIRVPAEVVYADLLKAAGPAAAHLLRNGKSIPVRIDARIHGKPTVYDEVEEGSLFPGFSWSVSRTEEVPIPPELREKARKGVTRALKKLF